MKRASISVQVPASSASKKLKLSNDAPKSSTHVYCHQDHQPHDPAKRVLLRCTHLIKQTTSTLSATDGSSTASTSSAASTPGTVQCRNHYCEVCLKNRYGADVKELLKNEETWCCPMCQGVCNCSVCRKKAQKAPLGRFVDGKPVASSPRASISASKGPPGSATGTPARASSVSNSRSPTVSKSNPLPVVVVPRIPHVPNLAASASGSTSTLTSSNSTAPLPPAKKPRPSIVVGPFTLGSAGKKASAASSSTIARSPASANKEATEAGTTKLAKPKPSSSVEAQPTDGSQKKVVPKKVADAKEPKKKLVHKPSIVIPQSPSKTIGPFSPTKKKQLPFSLSGSAITKGPFSLPSNSTAKSASTSKLLIPAPKIRKARGPKVALPPRVTPFPFESSPPPTLLVLSRLSIREFFIRFFAPEKKDSSRKASALRSLLDTLEEGIFDFPTTFGAWSVKGEPTQRALIELVLSHIVDSDLNKLDMDELDAKSISVQLEDEESSFPYLVATLEELGRLRRAGINATSRAYWGTLREFLEAEGYVDLKRAGGEEDVWEKEREEREEETMDVEDGKRRLTRAEENAKMTVEVGEVERLVVLEGLVAFATRSSGIRKAMLEGIEKERTEKLELTRLRNKAKLDLEKLRPPLNLSKPAKPTTGNEAELSRWASATAKINGEIKKLEAECARVQRDTQHDVFVSTAAYRVRFQPAGTDPLSNKYYILSPSPGASYPLPSSSSAADNSIEAPSLTSSILIHGKPFPGSSSSLADLFSKSDPKGKGKAQKRDKLQWFTISSPAEIEKLSLYIEYLVRKSAFDKKSAVGDEKVKEGQEEVDKDEEASRGYTELVTSLRCFADFIVVETEMREAQEKQRAVKGKLRASTRG